MKVWAEERDGWPVVVLVATTVPQAIVLERLRHDASALLGTELQLEPIEGVRGGGYRQVVLPLGKGAG